MPAPVSVQPLGDESGWASDRDSVSSSGSEPSSFGLFSSQDEPGLSPLLLSDCENLTIDDGPRTSTTSMDFIFDWEYTKHRERLAHEGKAQDVSEVHANSLRGALEELAKNGKGGKWAKGKKLAKVGREKSIEEQMMEKNIKVCPMDDAVHYGGLKDIGDIRSMDVTSLSTSDVLFSKEYAELSFICRVMDMALDTQIPLLDRFMFVCIVSSNLDEQFAKRLGNIPRFEEDEEATGVNPTRLLKSQVRPRSDFEDNLATAVRIIVERQHECLIDDLLPALKKQGVEIVLSQNLNSRESKYLNAYFRNHLHPILTPMSFDATHPFPLLQSHGLYILLVVTDNEVRDSRKKVYFRIPADGMRLIPVDATNMRYTPVEEVIVDNIALVCQGVKVIESYTFRVTRNTKLVIDDDSFRDRENLLDFIYEEVHRRRSAPATRLEVQATMPGYLRDHLRTELYLDDTDVYAIPGPLVGLASCMSLVFSTPVAGLRQLIREPKTPSCFDGLENKLSSEPGKIFSIIKERDVLVRYPRHDFNTTALLFIRSAARDPKVKAIKMVIYRAGSRSPLVPALIRAAKNGKEVTVLVELKASFDEVTNSEYARRLYRAGCNVTYGLEGLKTHCKTMLVVREESGTYRPYSVVSTGNWNPSTTKIYTDLSLFTSRQSIGDDVTDLFNTLSGYSPRAVYRHLLVAPESMLPTFVALINEEAAFAERGLEAAIVCQVNGLTEPKIAEALYRASQAGVKIQIIARGSCRLRPGIPGISDNIRVFSWVGHVLQHRRIWYFCANGRHKYYIGSADWRSRNLNDRVELVVPVEDTRIKKKLSRCLESLLHDPGIWRMSVDGRYYRPANPEALKETDQYKATMKKLKTRRVRPKITGERAQDGMSATESSDVPSSEGKRKRSYEVNIRGNLVTVDKIKAGAVIVRLDPGGSTGLQVLLVFREDDDDGGDRSPSTPTHTRKISSLPVSSPTASIDEPLWSIVKVTIKDQENAAATAIRIAQSKAGVLNAQRIASIGWVYRPRRRKKTAVSVIVLKAKEERPVTAVKGLREKKWFDMAAAIKWAADHKDAFLRDTLTRTMHAATAALAPMLREREARNSLSHIILSPNGDKEEKALSVTTSEDSHIMKEDSSREDIVGDAKRDGIVGGQVEEQKEGASDVFSMHRTSELTSSPVESERNVERM